MLVFAFAFISGADVNPAPGVVAGILWVSVLFSGTVALGRTFDRERENEAIRSLLLSPVPRPAIYLGKLVATSVLMGLVQLVVVPLCGLLFSAELGRAPLHLALTLVLGTLGFAAVGVVLSAALLRARSRDTLLASLLYPVVVPVFLAGAQATSQLLDPGPARSAGRGVLDALPAGRRSGADRRRPVGLRAGGHRGVTSRGRLAAGASSRLELAGRAGRVAVVFRPWQPTPRPAAPTRRSSSWPAIAAVGFLIVPFLIARAPIEPNMGPIQKIFYFHVPTAWILMLSTLVCGGASLRFLFKGTARSDATALASAELGVLFGICALVSGPLWGRVAWGKFWTWDARQTTTLLLWLLLMAYLLARKYGGPASRKLAAALALFAAADVPLVYYSATVWRTLHPTTAWSRRWTRPCGRRCTCRCCSC